MRLRHLRGNGSWLWVELEYHLTVTEGGEPVVVCELQDISEEMRVHEALAETSRALQRLVESLPVGVVRLAPDGSGSFANMRALSVLRAADAAAAAAVLQAAAALDADAAPGQLAGALRLGRTADLDVQVVRAAPSAPQLLHLSLIPLGDGEGQLVCLEDVTERRRVEQDLHHRATVDALTGCANRAATVSALREALARGAGSTAVVFIDLDGFKAVNDELGHAAGDELLVETAQRLRTLTRPQDLVGRMGGDEFVVVLRGVSATALQGVVTRLQCDLPGVVVVSTGTAALRASVGGVMAEPGDDDASLLARADARMYAAKALTRRR